MALNKEDKADVSRSMGKALANKVSTATKDKKGSYWKKPSSLVPGKTKGQLNKDIMSGSYFDKHNKGQGL